MQVDFVVGLPLEMRGPSYTAVRVAQAMQGAGLDVSMYAPLNRWPEAEIGLPVFSGLNWATSLINRIPFRLSRPILSPLAERKLLRSGGDGTQARVVYPWSEVGIGTSRKLKSDGIAVVREKTNCGKLAARSILDEAYASVGKQAKHGITEELINKEAEELDLADYIFCPSPMVTKTLGEIGIPKEKCIGTSYGWEPERFVEDGQIFDRGDKPIFLFVGYICVNKGAHILLRAWAKAKLDARLILVGNLEPAISDVCGDLLERDDVEHISYTRNLGAIYRAADWFVFPSLAEGGPQVTYEAGGLGVPGIVSEMGAGAFTRDGQDGLVIRESTVASWTDAIVRGFEMPIEERHKMGRSAKEHAKNFTWQAVGSKRARSLMDRIR